jgi:signal recognition particle receptor subunit alpha
VKAKEQRKWGDSIITDSDMAQLDFSVDKSSVDAGARSPLDLQALVDEASLGTRTNEGMYEVKDWEFGGSSTGTDDLIAQTLANTGLGAEKAQAKGQGTFGGLFARLTGGKTLTEEDLQPVLEAMKQRLMQKNVAKEIADKVCEGVGEGLIGKKIGGFQSEAFRSVHAVE